VSHVTVPFSKADVESEPAQLFEEPLSVDRPIFGAMEDVDLGE
jgi:hypothetical protein